MKSCLNPSTYQEALNGQILVVAHCAGNLKKRG